MLNSLMVVANFEDQPKNPSNESGEDIFYTNLPPNAKKDSYSQPKSTLLLVSTNNEKS